MYSPVNRRIRAAFVRGFARVLHVPVAVMPDFLWPQLATMRDAAIRQRALTSGALPPNCR
jgi:hypothetical protein